MAYLGRYSKAKEAMARGGRLRGVAYMPLIEHLLFLNEELYRQLISISIIKHSLLAREASPNTHLSSISVAVTKKK